MMADNQNNNFAQLTKLVLLHKQQGKLLASKDSIYRLKLTLKKRKFQDSIEFGQCCICTRAYDAIVKDSLENIVISDCNHVFCLTCYLSMIESGKNAHKQVHCPVCKAQNKSYLVFSQGEEDAGSESLNLRVNSIKRLDIEYYQNLKCSAAPGCQNYALFVCDLCHKADSQSCISCCSSPHNVILQQYNNTIFYCGCSVDAEEICFSSQAAPFLQKLRDITTQNSRDLYLQQALFHALKQKSAVNSDNSKKYCPFCPHYSHAELRKTNEHIRHVHAELAVQHGYAETMCFKCNTAFVSQKTIQNHNCKKDKASKSFARKILSAANQNQFEPPIQKNIAPNSLELSTLNSTLLQKVQIKDVSASFKEGVSDSNISVSNQDSHSAQKFSSISSASGELQSLPQQKQLHNKAEQQQLL